MKKFEFTDRFFDVEINNVVYKVSLTTLHDKTELYGAEARKMAKGDPKANSESLARRALNDILNCDTAFDNIFSDVTYNAYRYQDVMEYITEAMKEHTAQQGNRAQRREAAKGGTS